MNEFDRVLTCNYGKEKQNQMKNKILLINLKEKGTWSFQFVEA